MQCKEIMKSDVRCVEPSDTVQQAAQRMKELNVGFLPVCDPRTGRALGTITDRDIAIRVAAANLSPGSCKVDEVMSREVIACGPEDDISAAERLMCDHRKSRIMIIDGSKKLVGVISLSDIAEKDSLRRAAATMREVSSREVRA